MKTNDHAIIRVENLHKSFGDHVVLNGLNMTVYAGQNYVLLGESGCGKSALLRTILGLQRPDEGRILLWGKDIATLSEDEMNAFKLRMSYVFQGGALLNYLDVAGNVGVSLNENTDLPDDEITRIVDEKLRWVNLAGTQDLRVSELSGGMKKRVAIARALATSPEVIFYDEPTTGLDPPLSDTLDKLIYDLNQKLQNTSITITHDPVAAFYFGDRFGMMHDGKMIFEGTKEELRDCDDKTVVHFVTRKLHHDDRRRYYITGQKGRPGKKTWRTASRPDE